MLLIVLLFCTICCEFLLINIKPNIATNNVFVSPISARSVNFIAWLVKPKELETYIFQLKWRVATNQKWDESQEQMKTCNKQKKLEKRSKRQNLRDTKELDFILKENGNECSLLSYRSQTLALIYNGRGPTWQRSWVQEKYQTRARVSSHFKTPKRTKVKTWPTAGYSNLMKFQSLEIVIKRLLGLYLLNPRFSRHGGNI